MVGKTQYLNIKFKQYAQKKESQCNDGYLTKNLNVNNAICVLNIETFEDYFILIHPTCNFCVMLDELIHMKQFEPNELINNSSIHKIFNFCRSNKHVLKYYYMLGLLETVKNQNHLS